MTSQRCQMWLASPMLVVALTLASCTGSAVARPQAPKAPPILELTMTEYRYSAHPSTVPAGRVVFRFRNRGDQPHQPILVALPNDLPPLEKQLKLSTRRPVETIASSPGFRPGVTGASAVDMKAGQRYAFICSLVTADGKEHAKLGMAWEFRAGGASGGVGDTQSAR